MLMPVAEQQLDLSLGEVDSHVRSVREPDLGPASGTAHT
jgi:hypothetical protein